MSQDYLAQLNQASQNLFQGPNAGGAPGVGVSQAVLQFQAQAQNITSSLTLELRQREQDIVMLDGEKTRIAGELEALRATHATVVTQLSDANQKVILAGTELTAKLAEKETEHKPVVDELETLKAELEKLKGEITALTTRAETAETALAAVKKTANNSAADALGLKPDGTSTEKGEASSETETLTVEQAQAAAALAAAAGTGGQPPVIAPDKAALRLEYYERLNNMNMYGGQHTIDFQVWFQANRDQVLTALGGGIGPVKLSRPAEPQVTSRSKPFASTAN